MFYLKNLAPSLLDLPKSQEERAYVYDGELILDDEIKPALQDGFYTYHGSLTTPPCTEDVTWVILAHIGSITQSQLDILKGIFTEPANNRPLQLLHNRTVSMNYGGAVEVKSNASNFTGEIPLIVGQVKLVVSSAATFIEDAYNREGVQRAIAAKAGVKHYLVEVQMSIEEEKRGGVQRRLATSITVVTDFKIAQPQPGVTQDDLAVLVNLVNALDTAELAQEIEDQINNIPGATQAPVILVSGIDSEIPNLIDPNSLWDYLLPGAWSVYYPHCAGQQQSPIDIVLSDVFPTKQDLPIWSAMTFQDVSPMTLKNDGKGLQLAGEFSTVMYTGMVYRATEMRLHMPAEHAVDGVLAAGEIQIMHET